MSVSYTHLDVYKRQITDHTDVDRTIPDRDLIYNKHIEIVNEYKMFDEYYNAVSYTHLDVYKRQV